MFSISARWRGILIAARARRFPQRISVLIHDTFVAAISFAVSVNLRLGDDATSFLIGPLMSPWIIFTGLCALVFWISQVSRGMWRYTSMSDMIFIARAVTLALLLYLLVTFFLYRMDSVPRSTLIINWLVLFVLLSAPRVVYRLSRTGTIWRLLRQRGQASQVPILLIGTGDSAELFLRHTERTSGELYYVTGLIDEDGTEIGQSIHGRPVLGRLEELRIILDRLAARGELPRRLILTRPLPRDAMQEVMRVSELSGVPVARLPRLTDFEVGEDKGVHLQPIALEDLLGRIQTKVSDDNVRRHIAGQRVLVTGAGGSIGSELVRQLAALSPSHISLLDASEVLLYNIDLELCEVNSELSKNAILADVRDRRRIFQAMELENPSLVFHAAALKHVPMVEANKIEGVLTNTIGTRNVADACFQLGVKAMVLISTDKAVKPLCTMGASKRMAEEYCQALNAATVNPHALNANNHNACGDRRQTYFTTVRFGNVLGSNGSVVPLFKRQLAAGGPITITDPRMCRYFMSVNEAVELVLHASAMISNDSKDDHGSISVLDMGKPIKIMDLAKQMIRLAGLTPGRDIEIKVTGIRPGEKLEEELFHEAEPLKATTHPSLRLASPHHASLETVRQRINQLEEACIRRQEERVTSLLQHFVSGFKVETSEIKSSAVDYADSYIETNHLAEKRKDQTKDHRVPALATPQRRRLKSPTR